MDFKCEGNNINFQQSMDQPGVPTLAVVALITSLFACSYNTVEAPLKTDWTRE